MDNILKSMSKKIFAIFMLEMFVNIFLILKILSAYYACCNYSNTLQTSLIMETNAMNPDQTAPTMKVLHYLRLCQASR